MGRRHGHTKQQMLAALRPAEGGTTVVDVCRQVGVSERGFYLWNGIAHEIR